MCCSRLLPWDTFRRSALLGGLLVGLLAALPTRAQPANADALREAVHDVLEERYASEMHRLEIQIKRTGGDADQVQRPRVEFRSLDGLPRGSAQVRVYRRENGQWERAGWALLYIAHFDSVLVADRTMRSGDAISRSDVRETWEETTRFRGEPLTASAFDEHRELFATRHLREGRTLRSRDVRPAYAADTGESVTVQYRRGALQMELRCKAREPGFVGDVIRVYAPDTDAAYRVRLVEPGFAEWVETL